MNLSELIASHQEIITTNYMLALGAFFAVCIISLAAMTFYAKEVHFIFVLFAVFIGMMAMAGAQEIIIPKKIEQLNEWKEQVETHYISNLEVQNVEIDSHITTKPISPSDLEKNPDKLYHFKLKGNKEGIPFEMELSTKVVKVKDLKKPYLEVQQLEDETLVNETTYFPKGYYNPVLYIPEEQ